MKNSEFVRAPLKQQAHDHLFRKIVTDVDRLVCFLKLAIGEERAAAFDWTSVEIINPNQIDDELQEIRIDTMLSVKLKIDDSKFRVSIQLEHKSHRDNNVMKQLLRYQSTHYKHSDEPLLSIVIHHGVKPKWRHLPDFQQSLSWGQKSTKEHLENLFGADLLNFNAIFLSLPTLLEEEVDIDDKINSLVYLLVNIWKLSEGVVLEFFERTKRLEGGKRSEVIMMGRNYIKVTYPGYEMEALRELERQVFGDEVARMSPTIEEAWGDDFRKAVDEAADKAADKAVREDRLRSAVEMAESGYDIDEVIRITRVKRGDLEQLLSKGLNGKGKVT